MLSNKRVREENASSSSKKTYHRVSNAAACCSSVWHNWKCFIYQTPKDKRLVRKYWEEVNSKNFRVL